MLQPRRFADVSSSVFCAFVRDQWMFVRWKSLTSFRSFEYCCNANRLCAMVGESTDGEWILRVAESANQMGLGAFCRWFSCEALRRWRCWNDLKLTFELASKPYVTEPKLLA